MNLKSYFRWDNMKLKITQGSLLDVLALGFISVLLWVWFDGTRGDRIAGAFIVGGFVGAFTRELLRIRFSSRWADYVWLFSFIFGLAFLGFILG